MSPSATVQPIFFAGPEEFYGWLEAHHAGETELWIGYYKKATGKQTMSWSQAVDQALCFGWIDGVLRRIDDETHMQRFTPRRPGSNWSKVNLEKMARLEAEGLVAPAGRRAFEARRADRTGIYSFERDEPAELPPSSPSACEPRAPRTNTSRAGRLGIAARASIGSRAPSERRPG